MFMCEYMHVCTCEHRCPGYSLEICTKSHSVYHISLQKWLSKTLYQDYSLGIYKVQCILCIPNDPVLMIRVEICPDITLFFINTIIFCIVNVSDHIKFDWTNTKIGLVTDC